MDEAHESKPMPAVRLIFEYEGDEVRLVAQQPGRRRRFRVRPGRGAAPGPLRRDADGRERAAQPRPRPEAFSTSAEVFPEEPGGAITRVDVEPKGAFTVVVPAGAAAADIALLHVRPPAEPRERGPATPATTPAAGDPEIVELARFPLQRTRAEEGGAP